MPEGGTEGSGGPANGNGGGGGSGGANLLPWHLIPAFKPGETDLNDYSRRMLFLSGIWPVEHLSQLAPRAALACEGSAFQKVVRIPPEKLKANDTSGVQLLVKTLGGVWGKTTLENKYERFERAIYSTVQRGDETHESYMARHEVQFEDLLSQGASLTDVRAYILLRNSGLTSEEKKKIIVDAQGNLTYDAVVSALRLLGSKFFQEVQAAGKNPSRTKAYDVNYLQDDDEEIYTAYEENQPWETGEFPEQLVEQWANEGDEDALTMIQFEEGLIESVQNDPEMTAYLSTYTEARRKLTEKVKNRGFWPIRKGKSKGKMMAKGKGFRKPLAQRIAESNCRRCGQRGHWKWECPNQSSGQSTASMSTTSKSHTVNAMVGIHHDHDELAEPDILEELPSDAEDHRGCINISGNTEPRTSHQQKPDYGDKIILGCTAVVCEDRVSKKSWVKDRLTHRIRTMECLSQPIKKNHPAGDKTPLSRRRPVANPSVPGESHKFPEMPVNHESCVDNHKRDDNTSDPSKNKTEDIMFTSQGCWGIVDLGASQSVMGRHQVQDFLQEIPKHVRAKVREQPVSMTFRFGNNGTVMCNSAILIPIGKFWLRIAIVESTTPFLISNAVFRSLGAIVDTQEQTVQFRAVPCTVPLHLSSRRLFMLNVSELIQRAEEETAKTSVAEVEPSDQTVLITEINNGKRVAVGESQETHREENHMCTNRHAQETPPNHDVTGVNHACTRTVDVVPPAETADQAQSAPLSTSTTCCDRHGQGALPTFFQHGEGATQLLHSGGTGSVNPGGASHPHNQVWQDKGGTNLCRGGGQRPGLLHLVPGKLRRVQERQPQRVCSFPGTTHGAHGGSAQHPTKFNPARIVSQEQSQATRKGRDQGLQGDWETIPIGEFVGPRRGCGGRRLVASGSVRSSPSGGTDQSREQHGGRIVADHAPADADATSDGPRKSPVISSMQQGHMIDKVCEGLNAYIHYMGKCSGNPLNPEVIKKNWVHKEMQEYMCSQKHKGKRKHAPIDLLEIYCSEESQMSQQGERQGLRTVRFGLSQGDLATYQGRCKLYDCLLFGTPRDVWMSPACKAWCRWNQFNASRSPELARKVMQAREQDEVHLMLCSAIFYYQVTQQNHFHLEQPKGSHMVFQEALEPIVQNTWHATCDQCTAGQLKNPETKRYLKKGMQFFTTSRIVAVMINQYKCSQEHTHDPVAGSFRSRDGSRHSVAQFTELYTAVFASRVCRALLASRKVNEHVCHHENLVEHETFVNDQEEDNNSEPDTKRRRLLLKQSPPSTYDDSTLPESTNQPADTELNSTDSAPEADTWDKILQEALSEAPRVGTRSIDQGNLFERIQNLCQDYQIRVIELCKGADRCRKPPLRLAKGEAPFRKTMGIHRQTGDTFCHDWTHWESQSVRKMIEKTQPARLLVSIFGKHKGDPIVEKETNKRESERGSETGTQAKKARIQEDGPTEGLKQETPVARKEESVEESPESRKEYHGAKYRNLKPEERHWLKKIHVNLGHPNKEKLKNVLNLQKCSPHLIEAIDDFQCSTCSEMQQPRAARTAVVHEEKDFNDCIGCDLVTWTSSTGEKHQFLHVIDMATNFHLARPVYQTDHSSLEEALQNTWFHWAGIPKMMLLDGESALCSEGFQQYCMEKSINTKVVAAYAHWQMGKVERHGEILQSMLSHLDKDKSITIGRDFEDALQQCCTSKNMLSRVKGYTPEILVLGKSSRLPGSLTNEPFDACNQASADSSEETPEAIQFRQNMHRREEARKAFVLSDNDATLRRAFLRRSRPNRGQHVAGSHVMFWRVGRWQGPGRVIIQEGQSVVWISHFGKVFRMAPEHVRQLSERETQNNWSQISQESTIQLPHQQGQGVFRYEDLTQQEIPAGQGINIGPQEGEVPVLNPSQQNSAGGHEGSQPDAEPGYTPSTPSSQHDTPEPLSQGTPAVEIPVPEDTELICEDYWITKGDKIIRVHNQPRQASFVPTQSMDCPVNPLMLKDDRITKGKDRLGHTWVNQDSWPIDNDPWKKDTEWTGLSIFFLCQEGLEPSEPEPQDAFTLSQEECWEYEIFLTAEDIAEMNRPDTRKDVFLATTAKKQRAEVKLSSLSFEHRQEFEKAKTKEIEQWLDTETVRRIVRAKIPIENIMRCRWILTWKELDPNDLKPGDPRQKAKAPW